MCLGTMLKFGRRYMKNTSFKRAMRKIDVLKMNKPSAKSLICSLNSHLGAMKNIDQYGRTKAFVEKALGTFGNVLVWNENKRCFNAMGL